jgi:thiol-disulfide isomerase/thioredoxin
MKALTYAASLAPLLVGSAAQAQTNLQFVDHGFGAKAQIGVRDQLLELSPTAPASMKKAPAGVKKPMYAVLMIGANPKPVVVMVDTGTDHAYKLYVDANGNGDLTDDSPIADWSAHPYKIKGQSAEYYAAEDVMVKANVGGKTQAVGVNFVWYSADPTHLAYSGDYGYLGDVKLGGKTYHAALVDSLSRGIFTNAQHKNPDGKTSSGVSFLIDLNSNGRYERTGERYDAYQPFNIGGTTYTIKGLGSQQLAFAKAATMVAEIAPPPALAVGEKILSFEAKTMDGTPVSFPSSYKGKVVMLDFWATWCGPCVRELPNVIKAYEKYHDRGYEILGVSFDRANEGAKVAAFTKEKNMPWQQIYEGKYWDTKLGLMYGIDSIPRALLVDGDTGEILAEGEAIRGDLLEPAIEKALARKKQR